MSLLVRKLLTSLLVFLTLIFSFIFISYAWFDNNFYLNSDALGRARIGYTSYFAGGTGIDTDPFIIAEPEHLSNLAYLQNLGKFNNVSSPYYFKVAHPTTGDRIDIDFSTYGAIPPIGDHIYPFVGVFDGNYSNLQFLTIDGTGKQDIGVFGYVAGVDGNDDGDYEDVGDWEASVSDLFIEEAFIISNPLVSEITIDFHEHNDHTINRATGYIAGHLGKGAILENVFVIAPTISSLNNADLNRSQYGLIGYNEADRGVVAGGPRTAYNFTLDFTAYAALKYAYTTYGNWYIINEQSPPPASPQLLTAALDYYASPQGAKDRMTIIGNSQIVNTTYNYSLSTLKIYSSSQSPSEAVYLIDKLIEDNVIIGDQDAQYSRENIDIVGRIVFDDDTKSFQLFAPASSVQFTVPIVDSYFTPTDYNASMLLYVKPTNQINDLGGITASYLGGGGIPTYYSGFNLDGTYRPNTAATTKTFPATGVQSTMKVSDAFTAVVIDPNTELMRVVDPLLERPDFYVFLVAVNSAQINFSYIDFAYQPQALIASNFTQIQKVDFVNNVSDTLADLGIDDYDFSLLNFGYDLGIEQKIEVKTSRILNGNFELFIDYDTPNGTFFYFDILNIYGIPITIYYKNGSGTYDRVYPILTTDPNDHNIIEIVLEVNSSGVKVVTVTPKYT